MRGAVEITFDSKKREVTLRERGLDFDEVQDHRLFGAEHRAGCDPEKERITNLSGCAVAGLAAGCRAKKLRR